MSKFVTTALAIAATSSIGFTEPSEDSNWLELDSEINSLASAVSAPSSANGPIGGWAALVRANYTFTSDTDPDISGFFGDDARVSAWGEVGDYSWRLSMNAGPFTTGGFDMSIEDAWVKWACGEYFTAMLGSYRPRVLLSNSVWEENQLFINRSILGNEFDFFDLGVGAEGSVQDFSWYAQIMNGFDGPSESHIWLVRGEYHLNGGRGDYEGAFGSSDDLMGTVGATYYMDDTSSGDAGMYALDLGGSVSQVGFGFEIAFTDDDFSGFLGIIEGDSEPWSAYVSYLLNQEFEVGLRFEDLDDSADSTLWTAGVSWYHSGKNAKWNAEVSETDSDIIDAFIVQVGLSIGASS